jgi:hypothetical protein
VSAQFPRAAVSASTPERETKRVQQENPLGEEVPDVMVWCSRRRGTGGAVTWQA